ncbi:recombinase [Salmonella enterica]|nr:recombinase [Salmonella enterica subsp. enterica serovar Enteritidis]EHS5059541.1 recombinase [Salmonella enterica]
MRALSEKTQARRECPPKDEVRLVPLTDISYVRQITPVPAAQILRILPS